MYFQNINSLDNLKKEYKRLVKIYHPDRPTGNLEMMQEINAEYDRVFELLKNKHNQENPEKQINETPEQFREVISKIINFPGIEIELCGNWIWVSGETKKYKDQISEAGFHWAFKKLMWYWRPEEYKTRGRGSKSMDYIREKYGSEKIKVGNTYALP